MVSDNVRLLGSKASFNQELVILINGEPTIWFQIHEGLKQGDPLFPLLFIIVVDILACMMEKASSNGLIQEIGTEDFMTKIQCLQYVDDTLLFYNASKFSANDLKFIL